MSNDSKTTERDELARIAVDAMFPPNAGLPDDPMTWPSSTFKTADAILAAGYRKPRSITAVEELDALPVGSVIRAANGEVFEKQANGPYCDGPHDWQSFEGTYWNGETFVFPVTVLHEPEAEVGA